MTQFLHIDKKFQHIATLSNEDRIRFIAESRWIPYPTAVNILDQLRRLMDMPIRTRMPNVLIVGEPNNGKTTIVERFNTLHGEAFVDSESNPVIPILSIQSPPSADEKGFYISVLESFYTPYRATDAVAKLRYQVIHQFRHCRTKILIVDEFHSLLTGSAIKQREVMNAIKFLCNELAIPIVGVGTREAVRVLHSDPQHASRFDVLPLPEWGLNQQFQKLVAGFERITPLRKPSKLHLPKNARILHSISGGNLGNLRELVARCAEDAILSGEETISLSNIEDKAWLRPTRGIRELKL